MVLGEVMDVVARLVDEVVAAVLGFVALGELLEVIGRVVGVVVGTVAGVVIGAVEPGVTVFWKQEQALLTLIVAYLLTKLGRGVEAPTGSAKRPGQKASASGAKVSKALRTSSSLQFEGRLVGGFVAVAWKHSHALLTLGLANELT